MKKFVTFLKNKDNRAIGYQHILLATLVLVLLSGIAEFFLFDLFGSLPFSDWVMLPSLAVIIGTGLALMIEKD